MYAVASKALLSSFLRNEGIVDLIPVVLNLVHASPLAAAAIRTSV